MNQLIYNGSLAAGTVLAATGAGVQWGLGLGLMTAGGLVIALTMAGAWLFGRAA
jgi:hypothetical protein